MYNNAMRLDEHRFATLSLAAQTAYAELFEQTQARELAQGYRGLTGSFHKQEIKGRLFWYLHFRALDGRMTRVYVGPDNDAVRNVIDRWSANKSPQPPVQVKVAQAVGLTEIPRTHFRIIHRLAEVGFFRAGGLLIGTHAFLAYGNHLGVRWADGQRTLDVDFAHAGTNVSLALPSDVRIDGHGALKSLDLGLLPAVEFGGGTGAQFRNPKDPTLRVDFLTQQGREDGPVHIAALNLALEPLKFMEFSLEAPTQAVVHGAAGACIVNVPAPERFAVHKMLVYGERKPEERAKATKDLLQVVSLVSFHHANEMSVVFNAAWNDAWHRGKGWQRRLEQARAALLRIAPEVSDERLWALSAPPAPPSRRRTNPKP